MYTNASHQLTVSLSDALPFHESTLVPVLSVPCSLAPVGSTAWIGFTAATGGLNQRHEVFDLAVYRLE